MKRLGFYTVLLLVSAFGGCWIHSPIPRPTSQCAPRMPVLHTYEWVVRNVHVDPGMSIEEEAYAVLGLSSWYAWSSDQTIVSDSMLALSSNLYKHVSESIFQKRQISYADLIACYALLQCPPSVFALTGIDREQFRGTARLILAKAQLTKYPPRGVLLLCMSLMPEITEQEICDMVDAWSHDDETDASDTEWLLVDSWTRTVLMASKPDKKYDDWVRNVGLADLLASKRVWSLALLNRDIQWSYRDLDASTAWHDNVTRPIIASHSLPDGAVCLGMSTNPILDKVVSSCFAVVVPSEAPVKCGVLRLPSTNSPSPPPPSQP